MSRYVAFLRAINVGGHRITNDDLRASFEAMRFEDVKTFRASGNVIFSAKDEPLQQLTALIEESLASSLGYEVRTFLRSEAEVREIAADEPFPPPQVEASGGKLQVALLESGPAAAARKEVLALATDQDGLAFGNSELYWLPSGGILDSALDLKLVGTLLGVMTLRTKGTVEQIASKHFAA